MNKICFILFLFSTLIHGQDLKKMDGQYQAKPSCDHENKIPKLSNEQREETKKILSKKCQSKNGEACLALGMLYIFDEKNEKLGINNFQKSCSLGEKDGCFHLALKLKKKEKKKSIDLLTTNCKLGHIKSCRRAAEMNQEEKNSQEAINLYQLACKKEDLKSCYKLAMLEKNLTQRLLSLKLNCEKGHQLSCRVNAVLERKFDGVQDEKL